MFKRAFLDPRTAHVFSDPHNAFYLIWPNHIIVRVAQQMATSSLVIFCGSTNTIGVVCGSTEKIDPN